MDQTLKILLPVVVTFLLQGAAFWGYLLKRSRKKDVNQQMLMGLVQHQITTLGMSYIERGWVTADEYDDLLNYFYKPYVEAGGNGSAERIMHRVQRLDFREDRSPRAEITETTPIRSTDLTGGPGESHARRLD